MKKLEVVAVLPAYNPSRGFAGRLEALRRQVDAVVVVDDGSRSRVVVANGEEPSPVMVVRQLNKGIAAAINVGIATARSSFPDVRFILTVDQDTLLPADYLDRSVRAFEAARAAGVAVSATATARYNDKRAAMHRRVSGFNTAIAVAQSGMLFSVEALETIGLFDDSLVIDVVETDWVLRARSRGFFVVLAAGTSIEHPVGEPVPLSIGRWSVNIGGRQRFFSQHSAIRRYYITRNRLLVYPHYLAAVPDWIIRDTIAELKTLTLSLAFGAGRRQQTLAWMLGTLHGLAGKRGKLKGLTLQVLSSRRTPE